jgi:hypothetical protein
MEPGRRVEAHEAHPLVPRPDRIVEGLPRRRSTRIALTIRCRLEVGSDATREHAHLENDLDVCIAACV